MERLITIDGGAHTGKSSAARRLAQTLGWEWVSIGAFYRGLACVAGIAGVGISDPKGLVNLIKSKQFEVVLSAEATRFLYLGKDITQDIFTPWVGETTPMVSKHPEVRKGLLKAQRDLVLRGKGLIAEGRDCGTVVFPSAPLKVYFTVNDEAAADRFAKAHHIPMESALSHVRERNQRDTQRVTAKMEPASDAVLIDTSHLDQDQVFEALLRECKRLQYV